MRVWLCGLAVLLVWNAFAGTALGQVRGTIFGPGARQVPIALSALAESGGGDAGVEFADIVGRDLGLSGLFRIVPRDTYIEGASPVVAEEINFGSWSAIGALALVKGSVERTDGEVTVEARLFDVSQRRVLTGRRYRGGRSDLRRMANRFADEILAVLTGERGPFDSRIAFLSTRGGRFKDVYVMSPDGGDVRRLTSDNTINLSPAWGPGGASLLFTSYRGGASGLFSIDLAGGRPRPFGALDGSSLGATWSPDGSAVAVTIEREGNSDIALLAPDGSRRRFLTDHRAIDVSPAWSPDGRELAFCSNRGGGPQIYVVGTAGGTPRRVTRSGSYNTSPSWSPKGDRIAYASRVGGAFQVFTVSPDGTDVRQITNTAGSNEDPKWSPDGRYIVFSSTRHGAARLYVTDASGSSQIELTAGGGGDTSPAWSGWLD